MSIRRLRTPRRRIHSGSKSNKHVVNEHRPPLLEGQQSRFKRKANEMQRNEDRKRLVIVLILVVGYMAAEIIGGLLSGSLALLADAGHMFSDAAALSLSLFALWIAGRPATRPHTFGYYRAEILSALANGVALVVIAVFVIIEAVQRFRSPSPVMGKLMMGIAVGGLIINILGVWILHGRHSNSLNIQGAWMHMLADLLGSVITIAAGVLIWVFKWYWADPAGSLLLAGLVVYSAWKLLVRTVGVLMEATPSHLDIDEVRNALLEVEGVSEIHDLHVWTITSGLDLMSAHIVISSIDKLSEILRCLQTVSKERFDIQHSTFQLELEGHVDCELPV